MRYTPAFDGLRAIAVSSVFLFHQGRLPGGWIGVDIFFVLSGYLITSILLKEHETSGAISLPRFYMRRAFRLLPALVITVCVAVVLAAWFHNKMHATAVDALAALFYVADYRYAFMPVSDTALGHTWSLSVEEQFYFIWPFLLILLLKWNHRVALWVTLFLIVVIAGWRTYLFAATPDPFYRIYFAFDARADELLVGCALAFLLWQARTPTPKFLNRLWPLPVLFLAVFALNVSLSARALEFGYPLLCVAVAYLIVVVTSGKDCLLTYLLSFPLLVAFGRISYGFYLWHYLILQEPHIQAHLSAHKLALNFALALAASVASYWLIERPFLRLKSLRFSLRTGKAFRAEPFTTANETTSEHLPASGG